MAERIAGRYQLISKIGSGGMGEVYRALDRLSGETVALKRVLVPAKALLFASRTTDATANSLRLSLAREFRALASLRHPHIISVIDYGFASFAPHAATLTHSEFDEQDTQFITRAAQAGAQTGDLIDGHYAPANDLYNTPDAQPYFTMAFLEGARPFDQAMYTFPLSTQITLITQMLQALAYLHRHGILHRDLKPGNVLVTMDDAGEPRLHLVDFGLAEGRGASGTISGTLMYIAPESLETQPLSEATDLYAVGVMLYEVFAGHHPFFGSARLVHDIRHTPPDMTALRHHPELQHVPLVADVIKRLLAKNPLDRYDDAHLVVDDLCAAVGLPPLRESTLIRESYLQAAKFVGRTAEMATLAAALGNAGVGKGSAWLIGGESGVGKSRLLDELRIQALVAGVIALRGQAVAGAAGENSSGGVPYQLWRDVARRLALAFRPTDGTPLDDGDLRDLSVLRTLVPDIEDLIGLPVPPLPPLIDAKAQHFRLAGTILAALRRLGQPVLLILEDIQWTGESLDVLKAMIAAIARMPILIVASYRDDERPDMPSLVQGARLLRLARLNESAISELSIAMLGESGASASVVELLQRETEGNAFFLVETVRALAEEAGGLSDIGRGVLPLRVFAGGVAQVIQRRLDRAPVAARSLLKLAAVAGRRLDLAVLTRAVDETTRALLDGTLTACADATVLDFVDGAWRFAHDKLRETLIDGLGDNERRELHRQIALAIESVYPDNLDQAAVLARHWGAAGDIDKERTHAGHAGTQAYDLGQFHDATRFFERALALTPPETLDALKLNFELIRTRRFLNDFEDTLRYTERATALARALDDTDWIVRVSTEQAYTAQIHGRYDEAGISLRAVRPLSLQIDNPVTLFRFLSRYALQLGYERQFDAAISEMHAALALVRLHGEATDEMTMLNNLGTLHYYRGERDEVMAISNTIIGYYRSVNDRQYLSDALGNRGVLLWSLKRYAEAVEVLLEALELDEQAGKVNSEVGALVTLGYCYAGLGDDDLAVVYLRSALRKALDGELISLALDAMCGIASVWAKQREAERAAEIYGLALSHPASDVDIETTVTPLIEGLRAQLDAATLTAALERGKQLSFEAAVAEALGH
ncbi:MAG: protein kinase [Chloroflexota bacterium]|nr:protein kinase [Chloroflexota bacterium]